MRVIPVVVGAVIGLSVLTTPATAGTVDHASPGGANPYLSWLADTSQVDYAAWRAHLAKKSAAMPSTLDTAALVVREAEPAGVLGRNDTLASAEQVRGFGTGAGRRPSARLLGQLSPSAQSPDADVYRFELRAGDVLGVKATGAAHQVSIFDPAGTQQQGSTQDLSALYPAASPLPRGGNAVADHVASVNGTHYVAVTAGSGEYEVIVQANRPPLERELIPQVVFLDFDGAQVDMSIFVEIDPSPGVRTLSPFSTFLHQWGLSPADEPALVAQIVRTVRENLAAWPRTCPPAATTPTPGW
jgi:hypothetical protein